MLYNDNYSKLKGNKASSIFEHWSATKSDLDTIFKRNNYLERLVDTLVNQKPGYFIDLEKILSTTKPGFAYASCDIISKSDTDVAFLMAADDVIKVWVNGKLHIKNDDQDSYLEKNKIVEKIHIKKGSNQILLEIANIKDERWNFNLSVSTINHVRENALIQNYYNTSENFVVATGDSLHLKISNPDFIPIKKNSTIIIYDVAGNLVFQQQVDLKTNQKVSLESVPEGAYSYKLYTDLDTLDGIFTYGDINNIYAANNLNETAAFDKELFDTYTFVSKRAEYLLNYAKERVIDWALSKKIAFSLYRLADLNDRYNSGRTIYGHGLQMRAFKSSIDNSDEYYQLYIPENHNGKLPLVVIVPYVTTVRPFFRGAVVANTERIEYIGKFAEKFGFAVLWPSSKIYARYNLTPIITQTLNEVLDDVSKYYTIDQEKIYLYGDCSGALQALLMATRHPDRFAAIAIEGSELESVNFGIAEKYITSPLISNNIFNLTDNLSNIPVFILHSKNDEKASIKLVDKFIDSIKINKGQVTFDALGDAYKAHTDRNVKLFSEPEIMYRIFKFFNKKKLTSFKNGFSYSTYGYYQDSVYGINITEKIERDKKSTIRMLPIKGNSIAFSTINVKKLTFNPNQIAEINKEQKVNILFNDQLVFSSQPINIKTPITVNLESSKKEKSKKTNSKTYIEPINKLFLKQFAVVKPSENNSYAKKALKQLNTIWKSEYLVNIPVIEDTVVSTALKNGINLIFLPDTVNKQHKIVNSPRIISNNSFININGKKVFGKQLSYAIISKNRANNLILHIGSNYESISEYMLRDVIQNGWNNLEIWELDDAIYQGSYN